MSYLSVRLITTGVSGCQFPADLAVHLGAVNDQGASRQPPCGRRRASPSDFRKARRRVPRPPHPPLRVDLSPEGEVGMWRGLALLYISLWTGRGRIAPASRVRGPFSDSRSRSDLANEGGGAHDGAGEAVMLALHQDHRAIAWGGQHFIEGQLQVGARLRVPH